MIHVAVAGTGFMAATHIKAIQKISELKLVALCNPSGRNLDGDFTRVAGNVGDPAGLRLDMSGIRAVRNFDDLLTDPGIHCIDITTPTATHARLAVAALKAGKHVLLEKPLAGTVAECAAIVEAAELAAEKGAFLMPAMCLRFWPEWAWVKEAVANRTYGGPLSARFRRVAEPPGWGHKHFLDGKSSGGGLLDLHIHDTDFAVHCFGKPHSVTSTGHRGASGAMDHVVTLYHYPGGPVVSAEGSWSMSPGFGFNMAYTVNLERATVDYDSSRGTDALKLYQPGKAVEVIRVGGADGYESQLRYLVECIQSRRAPSRVTAAQGGFAVQLCRLEELSILEGRTVLVE